MELVENSKDSKDGKEYRIGKGGGEVKGNVYEGRR